MKQKNEYSDLSPDELQQKLTEAQKELFNLRVQQSSGQVENPSRLRHIRRDIARIKTFQRQRVTA